MDFLKCGIYIQWIIIQLYKGNSVICYNMDVPWQHYAKRNKQSQRDKYINVWFQLYEVCKAVKFTETEQEYYYQGKNKRKTISQGWGKIQILRMYCLRDKWSMGKDTCVDRFLWTFTWPKIKMSLKLLGTIWWISEN